MDLNYWTTTILASGVVAAIVSGLFGYFGSLKVERLKNDLARRQGRATQLREAHLRLANLKQRDLNLTKDSEGSIDFMQLATAGQVNAFIRYLDLASIYEGIRPLLADGHKAAINEKQKQAKAAREQVIDLAVRKMFPDGKAVDTSRGGELLDQVIKTVDEFEVELKKQVEAAYEESIRIQEE